MSVTCGLGKLRRVLPMAPQRLCSQVGVVAARSPRSNMDIRPPRVFRAVRERRDLGYGVVYGLEGFAIYLLVTRPFGLIGDDGCSCNSGLAELGCECGERRLVEIVGLVLLPGIILSIQHFGGGGSRRPRTVGLSIVR
jgi:hypothetical protein